MIIELILPNSSMKKYINMVVGLLLILIFLQPLFQLFQVDVEEMVSQVTPTLNTSLEEENMKNSIELKKSEIQAQQSAYILEEMAVQMKNDVKEGLKQKYGVQITNISFSFEKGSQVSYETLEILDVSLVHQEKEEEGVVQKVVINVSDKEPKTKKESTPEAQQIKEYLYDKWQLENQTINLRWEGGV